jgi:transcriptional regulator with XRE-family HTH domain
MSTTLGRLLQSAREELSYSRTRAAELSGVNASTIEAWEVGRVLKPPFQDVVRLARVLSISMSELERCVMEEQDGEKPQDDSAGSEGKSAATRDPQLPPNATDVGLALLQRATEALGWDDGMAAEALNTSKARIGRLRRGTDELSVVEVMTLVAMLAAFPSGRGGATRAEVDDLLARLRGPRAG